MNKEQKCISLSLAKELQQVAKEKDFELPESEYYYIETNQISDTWDWELLTEEEIRELDVEKRNRIRAYDTSELGEIVFEDKTEAEARGKLLVFLIKNNLIK